VRSATVLNDQIAQIADVFVRIFLAAMIISIGLKRILSLFVN
jgi:hypothetical protein